MCNFLSLVSNGKVGTDAGKLMYFNWNMRKKCIDEKIDYDPDSHTSIADYFGYRGVQEDILNKYEFNPLTRIFRRDQINTTNDSSAVHCKCLELDFKDIVPSLVVKKIINPFQIETQNVTTRQKELLNNWINSKYNTRETIRTLVLVSVIKYTRKNMWDDMLECLWDDMWDSMRDNMRANMRECVWDSMRANMLASMWAYIGSFIKESPYRFQPCVDLWEQGLVPVFANGIWFLYRNRKGKVIADSITTKDGGL